MNLEELWKIVCRIPSGRAASYGEVGRALKNPASGYMVGRWLTQCPPDVPWWRVVAKDGHLPIAKQGPEQAMEQERLLQSEGVVFEDGKVIPSLLVPFIELTEG
ncbi:MAG: MGMT family protein [Fimbriimonas sp.]|nr:MGMT family protein [Fimbriimonas sp.]